MPVSAIDNLFPVADFIRDLRPKSVLDVGIGFGLYGALCRQILDIAEGRYERSVWQARICGVDTCAEYRNPLWDYVYDEVVIGNAEDVLERLPATDVALLCDVIEHFPKQAGLELVESLLAKAECLIVSTPLVLMTEENSYTARNPKERHLSIWEQRDFAPWLRATRLTSMTGVYLLSRHEIRRNIGYHSGDRYTLRKILRNRLPATLVSGLRTLRARMPGSR